MWQIIINGPGYFDTAYELPEGTTSLGRADENDIVLSGDLVSRRHALLVARGVELKFEDQQSRNGSRVNGQPVKSAQKVADGDVLVLGENTLVVGRAARLLAPPPPPTSTLKDVRSSIILAKSVSESFVLRALDNIFPFNDENTPSPHLPVSVTAPPQVESNEVAYESLLLVSRVAELLASSESREAFFGATVDLLMRAAGASTGVVLVRDATGALSPAVVRHRGKLNQGQVPVSSAIVDEALKQGEALAVADVQGDPRFSKRDSVVLYGVGQVLCIPLGKRRPYAGALYLNRSSQSHEGLDRLLDACTAVAHLLASGLEKFDGPLTPPPLPLQRGTVTALFADLSGFTAVARKLEPEVVGGLLKEFYQSFTKVVGSYEGTVVSFVGDSALAVFGAGTPRRDDAVRAIRAGLTLRADWQKGGASAATAGCAIKAGIHTGPGLFGRVTTGRAVQTVCVGDPSNTAAWLVGLAQGAQVLISNKTLAAVGARFEVEALGEKAVSGRQKIAVFEVKAEDLHVNTNPAP